MSWREQPSERSRRQARSEATKEEAEEGLSMSVVRHGVRYTQQNAFEKGVLGFVWTRAVAVLGRSA
jgi:hypothetical protein